MTRPHHQDDEAFLRSLVADLEDSDPRRLRMIEVISHLHPRGVMSPWDDDRAAGTSNGWGPGPIEDYAALSGQDDHRWHPRELIDIFIKRNVPRNAHGHLLDTDDNDGEYLRRAVDQALKAARAEGAKKERKRIREVLGL